MPAVPDLPDPKRTKGEIAFIDQMTRKLTVDWAHSTLTTGSLPKIDKVYEEYAVSKKWLSKKEPRTLTSGGWQTAARFLKR